MILPDSIQSHIGPVQLREPQLSDQNQHENRVSPQLISPLSPFNPRMGSTPIKTATDCHCTVVFLLLSSTLIVCIVMQVGQSINHFDTPFSSSHQPCMYPYPIIYMFSSNLSFCVSSCPSRSGIVMDCMGKTMCPVSVQNLKLDQQLSICQNTLVKHTVIVPVAIKLIRSVIQNQEVISIVVGFITTYCGFMVFTNLLFVNEVVYVWIGIFELLSMIVAGACIHKFHKLGQMDGDPGIWEAKHKYWFLMLGVVLALSFIYSALRLFRKKGQLMHLFRLMELSKAMLMDNSYLVLVVAVQIGMTLGIVYFYFTLIKLCLSLGYLNTQNTDPFNQFQPHKIQYFLIPLSMTVFLWAYAICLSSTRFVLHSITIEWYFNQKIKGPDYSRLENLKSSLQLLYIHFGTVCYASLLMFLPKKMFKCLNCLRTHNLLLVPWNSNYSPCFKNLTVYSHTYVILRSYQFNKANQQCCQLLDSIRSGTPKLYDLGDYYLRASLGFFVLFGVTYTYYSILFKARFRIQNLQSLLGPVLVVVVLVFAVCFNMGSLLGFVGDVLVMMHELDLQIGRQNYAGNTRTSAPQEIQSIFRQLTL